jgi:hypothetical protein
MPGFLGGSSGSSGTGGEISFPKEFIDPVTKLRVSQPENLIDTDFEYGLQPTKWETVELINNTPSFFSKSGDTTIPDIIAITTNAGTREITVRTGLDHGLAVGIPISVSGTKSITADGSYIINSIPNTTTFTYLCKDIQATTASIEDLYSSIITGEFFQGSQLRISDSDGITTDGESISTLTVTTPSAHGFGLNTPFYFLNLNSTISQEFQASNTAAKSFDASNSATAQTFDGSNTLASINIDWSNSATIGGITSNISSVSTTADTITVSHGAENFNGRPLGTPLYYSVTAGTGYFATNPRGVVFLKTNTGLGTSTSTFQVSAIPDGDAIDIESAMSGTFQLANQARLFAGNNVDPSTQTTLTVVNDAAKSFDGANDGSINVLTSVLATVTSYSGSLITVTSDSGLADLDWYVGRMLLYTTTGSAASGLTNNTTYFIDTFFQQGSTNTYSFTIKPTPTGSAITSISGGTGTQKFRAIGVSLDRDIFHVKNHGFTVADLLRYDPPAAGTSFVSSASQNYYYVETVLDTHNFTVTDTIAADGSSEARAATSATAILAVNPAAPDGAYWIKPTGWTDSAFRVHCIMQSNGGGWMLALRMDTNNFGSASRTPFSPGAVFVGDWAGWTYSTKSQIDNAFGGNVTNYAADDGTDAFSPVYIACQFRDVMIRPNRTSPSSGAQRIGWRHNSLQTSMRACVAQNSAPVYGNTQLFGNASFWYYSLDRRPDTTNGSPIVDRNANLWGFKIASDRHGNDYGYPRMAGGWPNVPGFNTYNSGFGGWASAQIGWCATSAPEQYGQVGGGFGVIDAAGTHSRISHHVWGWGSGRNPSVWDADRSSPYYGHAIYVRE